MGLSRKAVEAFKVLTDKDVTVPAPARLREAAKDKRQRVD
jgi:hypothetical protein